MITDVELDRLRNMARWCGTWATARHLRKLGYSCSAARWVLLTRHDVPVLRRALYRPMRTIGGITEWRLR